MLILNSRFRQSYLIADKAIANKITIKKMNSSYIWGPYFGYHSGTECCGRRCVTHCARQALDLGPPHIDSGTNQCAYFLLYTIPSFAEIFQEMRPESHRSEFKLSGQARQDSSLWGMMLPACRLPTHHASGFRNWPRTQTLHHCFP